MEKEYQIVMYAYVTANSLQEAEQMYEDGDYFPDYHEIIDYDENGMEVKYDQWDIEEMSNAT